MDRRKFITTTCLACAGLATSLPVLQSCSTAAHVYKATKEGDNIIIPISAFNENQFIIARSNDIEFDIFVKRISADKYSALLMKCTHRNNPVQRTSTGFVCHEHGSRFNNNGEVISEPAIKNMLQLPIEPKESNIIINLQSI